MRPPLDEDARRTSCDGKRRFDTFTAAETKARKRRRRRHGTARLNIYRCKHCRTWHIGEDIR